MRTIESTVAAVADRVGFAEELAIARATEEIARELHLQGLSHADLAHRLGVTDSSVSQVLGGRNSTLRTLARYAHALDREWTFRLRGRGQARCTRSPTLSTGIAHVEYVEYVEGDNDWGWWCWDWKDPEAFRAECIAQAAEELSLPPEQALPENAVVRHGYVRESTAGDEYVVRMNERPNGGHRATYVWGGM